MPAKPQHNKTFWLNGTISMEAATNPHVAAGMNKVLRAAGVVNPKAKVTMSRSLKVKSTMVHVFLDGINFEGTSKEEGWSCLSRVQTPTLYYPVEPQGVHLHHPVDLAGGVRSLRAPQVLLEGVLAGHDLRLQAALPRP